MGQCVFIGSQRDGSDLYAGQAVEIVVDTGQCLGASHAVRADHLCQQSSSIIIIQGYPVGNGFRVGAPLDIVGLGLGISFGIGDALNQVAVDLNV